MPVVSLIISENLSSDVSAIRIDQLMYDNAGAGLQLTMIF
jgi:hypothetical protein